MSPEEVSMLRDRDPEAFLAGVQFIVDNVLDPINFDSNRFMIGTWVSREKLEEKCIALTNRAMRGEV